MLKFSVLKDGKAVKRWPLRNAYLVGSDHNAMRGEIHFEAGMIICQKREAGPAALALQHPVDSVGELTIQTTLLPERDEPYLLKLELARHQLMILTTKLEDWQMFDLGSDHPVIERLDRARKLFFEALCHQGTHPTKSDELAEQCLTASLDGGEELALAHAELLLNKRKERGALPRHSIGIGVALDEAHDRLRPGLADKFDLIHLPTPWREIQPQEGAYNWEALDAWGKWAVQNRKPTVAGPVVSFEPRVLPDWVHLWENEFETLRDLFYEHLERVVGRYHEAVSAWNIVSGLHVNQRFGCSFEQLLELTRMGTMVVKQKQPNARAFVEIVQPFGEYYARNQQSIPPLTYADLLVQGSINFDGFIVKLMMGQPTGGQNARDLLQISSLLDRFSVYGKPVHLVVGVPSAPVTEEMIAADADERVDANSGFWRRAWSEQVQAHWLEAIMMVGLSKPFVESISWAEVMDHPQIELPMSGLVAEDLKPKPSLGRMMAFRKTLQSDLDEGGRFEVTGQPKTGKPANA
ncbi:MAG: endo-1,4-beta-xylanase [Phycisphaeraceae bacterium]|nr:endo-1,4-beta-xylanase [Phycisphaeraceae bacterium]